MKKITSVVVLALSLLSFKAICQSKSEQDIKISIDLNTIKEDRVTVVVTPPKFTTNEVTYNFPKIIPGTYSEDDYGKMIVNLKAFDKNGKEIAVNKMDENSWKVTDAKKLATITYQVNDTFDSEKGTGFGQDDIFSPAGTNIDAGKNFMINTHAELVENPIMYAKPDYTTFNVNGMDILIAVYSPNGVHTAESLTPEMKKVMIAQKNFLGKFNSTKKYSVLIYLSDLQKEDDAHGFGALEHPTATTVVMPEAMAKEELAEQLKDVVSHEFFHNVTPLTIHSNEIQYFDYNNPKMSEHLWMYEGVTEYFANLFQINQGLISEDEFYDRHYAFYSNECKCIKSALQRSIFECIRKRSFDWHVYRYYNKRKKQRRKRNSRFNVKII